MLHWQVYCCLVIGLIAGQSERSTSGYQFSENELNEHFHYKRSGECIPEYPPWMNTELFDKIAYNFLEYDKNLEETCNNKGVWPFQFEGQYKLPNSCESLTICNLTYCLTYKEEANAFIYTIPKHCSSKAFITNQFKVLRNEKGESQENFKRNSLPLMYDALLHSERSDAVKLFEDAKRDLGFNSSFIDPVHHSLRQECISDGESQLLVEGTGVLPTECSPLEFCNTDFCYVLPSVSNSYAFLYRKNDDPDHINLNLPSNCRVTSRTSHHLFMRSVPQIPSNIYSALNKTTSLGILNFNLPGYRYCGPGTDIEKMDDLGGPVNFLDDLCRDHDVDYMLGVPPEEADVTLLEKMYANREPFLPLFNAVFQAKRYYEKMFSSEYTSSLYYFVEDQKSLTFALSEYSVYQTADGSQDVIKHGVFLENRWKKILHDIWAGHCYAQSLPSTSQLGNGNNGNNPGIAKEAHQEVASGSGKPLASGQTHETPEASGAKEMDVVPVDEDIYPAIPEMYRKCRLVISEVLASKTSMPSFIELQRLVPRSIKTFQRRLSGYHLLLVRVGDPSTIYMSFDMNNFQMRITSEAIAGSARKATNLYFVLGSPGAKPDVSFDNIQMVQPTSGEKAIPEDDESTFAVILLHFPKNEASAAEFAFRMDRLETAIQETPIGDVHRSLIKKYIQDMVIFGAPCSTLLCDEFLELMPEINEVQPFQNIFSPIAYPDQSESPPFQSINRCSKTLLPMQIDSFAEGPATPGLQNQCPLAAESLIFKMQGIPLQSTAQKLILNANEFFTRYIVDTTKLHGSAIDMTSSVMSLRPQCIRRVISNYRATLSVETPGKKRPRPPHKQCQIDSFYADMITRIITQFYEKNRAPLANDIYKEFFRQVQEKEEDRRKAGEVVTPFTCHEQTFRKILRRLGYTYGKINLRDAVLLRPEIVMWRGRYLSEIRKNAASQSPMKVIYLDETWIDPFARTGKGWIPAKCSNYRERSKFTYSKHKIGRGPRLIVLNAGGEDGMFHPAMEVFPVKKKDSSGDYHDNVNAEFYLKWFEKLLLELTKTGNKYLIVQDNAPYHGTSTVPKSADRKQVLYDWLKENLPVEEKTKLLPIKQYIKPELWEMVKQQKKTRNFYVIDQMASNLGHKVLRLPPYNCDLNPIELVWKDVKHEVRKENTVQTLTSVEKLAKEIMLNYPVEKWRNHVKHVQKLEQQYWTQDGFFDQYMDNNFSLITPASDEDEEDSDENNVVPISSDVITSLVHDDVDAEGELLDI